MFVILTVTPESRARLDPQDAAQTLGLNICVWSFLGFIVIPDLAVILGLIVGLTVILSFVADQEYSLADWMRLVAGTDGHACLSQGDGASFVSPA